MHIYLPSYIKLPVAARNNYEHKLRCITCFQDSLDLIQKMHLFIKEYQEVFVVIKLQHLSENAIKPHFIPFSLKNNSKKWLYTMPTDS